MGFPDRYCVQDAISIEGNLAWEEKATNCISVSPKQQIATEFRQLYITRHREHAHTKMKFTIEVKVTIWAHLGPQPYKASIYHHYSKVEVSWNPTEEG